MTVNNVSPSVRYEGNGANTQWTFTMAVPDASVIEVYVTDAVGDIRKLGTGEYSVLLNALSGTNPTPQGGFVIYNPGGSPLPAGQFITIVRNCPPVQNVSVTNQSIIYPPIVEKEFDYLTMLAQQSGIDSTRAIKVPIGDPEPADLPPQAARINQTAFFNDTGDLVAGTPLDDTIMVSAAMQPVVQATTVQEAAALLGVYPDPHTVTASYVLIPDDNNRLIVLGGGAYYLVSTNDPTTYPADYRVQIVNNDTRAKLMNIFGYTEQFVLYPDQQVFVNRGPSGWVITRPGRWRPTAPKQLYVDAQVGSDNIAVADGLAVGTGAFQTVLKATQVLEQNLDGDFTINLSNAFHNMPAGGLILNKRLPGGAAYKIVGNVGDPSIVNIFAAAGTNGITVTDGAVLEISGMTLSGGTGSNNIFVNRGGVVSFGNVIFGGNPNNHNIVAFGGTINIDSSYHIAAGASAAYHIGVYYNSTVTFGKTGGAGITVTLNGNVSFTSGYYGSQLNSTIVAITTVTYQGGAAINTPKAQVHYNSVVNAGGANIPGDLAAAVSNGGFFF